MQTPILPPCMDMRYRALVLVSMLTQMQVGTCRIFPESGGTLYRIISKSNEPARLAVICTG